MKIRDAPEACGKSDGTLSEPKHGRYQNLLTRAYSKKESPRSMDVFDISCDVQIHFDLENTLASGTLLHGKSRIS